MRAIRQQKDPKEGNYCLGAIHMLRRAKEGGVYSIFVTKCDKG